MNLKRLIPAVSIFFVCLYGLPSSAAAATLSSILVNVAPENPAPGEDVTITLSSYAYDLDSVSISWSASDNGSASGIGLKSFSIKAPAAGSETRVVAKVSLPDGILEKVVAVRPSVMVLLWQANDSHVPPFYKGKALPSEGSEIKIVALPEIKTGTQIANPKNLVYAWKKDYANEAEASGYGKNFFLLLQDYLDDANTVSVTATTTDQKLSSAGRLDIRTFEPKIVFYKEDSELGTRWEYALSDGHIITGEEVIRAVPYFISPEDIRIPSLVWNWSINDTSVSVTGQKNILPVRAQGGTSGVSKIKLELTHKYKLFVSTAKELAVHF